MNTAAEFPATVNWRVKMSLTKQEATAQVAELLEQSNQFAAAARKLAEQYGLAFYYDGDEFTTGQDESNWSGSSC
jgi:predicted enzyme involved in methoxymalonyl-ACP biosynthesis